MASSTTMLERLASTRLLKGDLDYHLVRGSMVIIYFFFGYQKWFAYEAKELIPFFMHGPLIYWMYPVFGIKMSAYFRDDDAFDSHLGNLIRQLSEAIPPLGRLVAVPSLPDHFLEQGDRIRALRHLVEPVTPRLMQM